jgi:hypothetical protein
MLTDIILTDFRSKEVGSHSKKPSGVGIEDPERVASCKDGVISRILTAPVIGERIDYW